MTQAQKCCTYIVYYIFPSKMEAQYEPHYLGLQLRLMFQLLSKHSHLLFRVHNLEINIMRLLKRMSCFCLHI